MQTSASLDDDDVQESAPPALPSEQEGGCPLTTRELASAILTFVEKINGIEFYAYQKALAYRIIESLLLNDGACITGLYSRQCGKSETLGSLTVGLCVLLPVLAAIWPMDERLALFRDGIYIGVFAPKLDLSGPIYLKVRARAESDLCQAIMADPDIAVGLTQSRGDSLAFTNGSRVSARTASEATLVEGDTLHLALIDEAQRVSRGKVLKEIGPMLAARNGTMVKIGTAWLSKGGFHTDIKFNLEQQNKGAARNHYQFDYKQVIVEKRALYTRQKKEHAAGLRKLPADPFHLKYEKWVNAELARLGGNDNSEEFRMNFRLMWEESRMIAIKEQTLAACASTLYEVNVPFHGGFQVAGLDIAKTNDSTVLTILDVDVANPIQVSVARAPGATAETVTFYRKRVIAWLELQGSFEGGQYQAIVDFLRNYRVRFMYVDATGMGDPVCERLQVLLSGFDGLRVEPFKYNQPSKHVLYTYYLQEIDAGRFTYPASTETITRREYQMFLLQHINLEKEYSGSYLQCRAPDGEHDDYPNSSALAVLAARDAQIEEAEETPVVVVTTLAQARSGPIAPGVDPHSRANRYRLRRGGH